MKINIKNMNSLIRRLVFLSMLLVAAVLMSPLTAAQNIVQNSGFESAFAGGLPPSWHLSSLTIGQISRDTSVHHEGAASLRVTPTTTRATVYQNISVNGNTWYRTRGWIKGSSLGSKAQIYLIFRANGGANYVGEMAAGSIPTGTTDWTKVETAFKTASNVDTISVWLWFPDATPSGTAWFDDILVSRNYLENAGFESAFAGGLPPNWHLSSLTTGMISRDTSICHEGAASLRVTPTQARACVYQNAATVNPSTRYRISGWVKGENLGSKAELYLIFRANGGATYVGEASAGYIFGTQDWTRMERLFQTASNVDTISVWLWFPDSPSGSAWFDDILLERTDDTCGNALWNSSFNLCSNPNIPDFWAIPSFMPIGTSDWTTGNYYGVDTSTTSPVTGTQSLRINNYSSTAKPYLFSASYLSCLPTGNYTISAYMKAATAGEQVSIGRTLSSYSSPVTLTTSWQRYYYTFSVTNGVVQPCFRLEQSGVVWLAAPQLEEGSSPTTWKASLMDTSLSQGATHTPGAPDSEVKQLLYSALDAKIQYSYYTNHDTTALLRANTTLSAPVSYSVNVTDSNGLPVSVPVVQLPGGSAPGSTMFSLDISGLAADNYTVIIQASQGGSVVAIDSDKLTKLVWSTNGINIRINKHTRSIMDGDQQVLTSGFFDLQLYLNKSSLNWQIPLIKNDGFTACVCYYVEWSGGTEAKLRSALDQCQAQGLKVIMMPSQAYYLASMNHYSFAQLRDWIVGFVSRFKDHPAILAWYLADEPHHATWEAIYGFAEADLVSLYQAVKTEDPYRPAFVNWNRYGAFMPSGIPYGTTACTDIMSLDSYIFTNGLFGEPLKQFANDLAKLDDITRPLGMPTLIVAQTYGYSDATREPTVNELKCMTYLDIIYGSRLPFYFTGVPMYPLLWQCLDDCNSQTQQFGNLIYFASDATEKQRGIQNSSLHYTIWTAGGDGYLIVANSSYTTSTLTLNIASITGKTIAAIELLFETGSYGNFSNGTLTDTLQPAQSKAYKFTFVP